MRPHLRMALGLSMGVLGLLGFGALAQEDAGPHPGRPEPAKIQTAVAVDRVLAQIDRAVQDYEGRMESGLADVHRENDRLRKELHEALDARLRLRELLAEVEANSETLPDSPSSSMGGFPGMGGMRGGMGMMAVEPEPKLEGPDQAPATSARERQRNAVLVRKLREVQSQTRSELKEIRGQCDELLNELREKQSELQQYRDQIKDEGPTPADNPAPDPGAAPGAGESPPVPPPDRQLEEAVREQVKKDLDREERQAREKLEDEQYHDLYPKIYREMRAERQKAKEQREKKPTNRDGSKDVKSEER